MKSAHEVDSELVIRVLADLASPRADTRAEWFGLFQPVEQGGSIFGLSLDKFL